MKISEPGRNGFLLLELGGFRAKLPRQELGQHE
jgi:hypothetical protein